MGNARLLSSIVITAGVNDQIRVNYNGLGLTTTTLTDGTYYMETGAGSGDFIAMIKGALESDYGGGWKIFVVGVDGSSGTHAEGTLEFENINPFIFDSSDADWTLDPRILGLEVDEVTSNSATYASTHTHRYGWYPQDLALKEEITIRRDTIPSFTSARYLDVVDDGEYGAINLGFDRIHPSLVTTNDAAWASAADMLLTAGDVNCSFERFCQDLAGDSTLRWRYYADAAVISYDGPYVFGPTSVLWSNPAAACPVVEAAGKRRYVEVDGIEAGS